MSDELFLPEPLPRNVRYTVISVDDHVVEPAHTFEGRLPAARQDRAPRIVETPEIMKKFVHMFADASEMSDPRDSVELTIEDHRTSSR